ncbi:anti-sigma factor, partial [Cytophagia bacterium CHB2]|nr:anti-sigma factor [Cytophagia bacterium CHB2]
AQERQALAQQVQAQQRKLNELETALAFHRDFAKAIQKPRVMLVDLSAPQGNHNGRGKVIFDRDERRAFFISLALPRLPENEDYQLWHIGKSGPVNGGVFQVDSSGYAAVQVLHLPQTGGDIAAFAVTREPKGGSAKPTLTQMYLLGKA